MFKSRYLRLSTKILLNSAAIIVCFCLVVGWLARSLRDEIVAEKVAALSQLVDVAHSQLVEYDQRVRSGELTVADAQEQARQRLRNLRYEGKEYFWINDRTPVMVMHPYKPELEGKSLENTADPDGRYLFREMVAVCREKGEGVVRYRWPHPESTAPVAKLSYVKEFEPWGWIVGTGIYIDGLNRQLASTLIPVLVFSLLAAAGSFAVSVFTSRSITRPIGEGVAFARDLAAGDLTRQLDLRRRDEVGALAESLNRMGADLQMMIGDIADGVRTLSASSTELLSISQQMADNSRDTTQRVENVAAATEQMSGGMSAVAAAMGTATDSVQSLAGATEEMSASISEIARSADRARDAAHNAVDESLRATARVNALGDAARDIGDITEAIRGISAQTNLLALNATIEAAHAGEAGRGFAVVAGEIKMLAQRTDQATEDIRQRISGIQEATAAGVHDIERIAQAVEEISGIVVVIAAAIEEQAATSRGMSCDIARTAEGLQDVNRSVKHSSTAADVVAKDIIRVSAASVEVNAGSDQLRESAAELSRFAESLQEKVGRFRM